MESLNILIPTELDAQLAQRAVQSKQTKSEVVQAALAAYFAPESPLERSLSQLDYKLEYRLTRIERSLTQWEQKLSTSVPGAISPSREDAPQTASAESEEEDYDEPDEVLLEFLEFAPPAMQEHFKS